MAGGKGTRISSLARDIPKPMIQIESKPVLEHEIECLREQGFTDLIITVGHLGNVIMEYFGDGSACSPVTGEPFGVHITYFVEETPLGNAGALFKIKEELTEDFLLLNGDAVFDINFHKFVAYHKKCGGRVTLFTHPNNHPYDSSIVVAGENNEVLKWLNKEDERPRYYRNRVNAGLHVLSPTILDKKISATKVDLDRELLKPLAGSGEMFVYDSPEYVKDMGTPKRYESVCHDFQTGLVRAKNLRNKQKAIFLDRDGVLNEHIGFLTDIEQFALLPGVVEAIKKINQSGRLAIVITNQPVLARGDVTPEELQEIHNKMETRLGEAGAYIDAIYYCPHHPHKGYDGEVAKLKVQCTCRKPKPGMLFDAAEDFNIELGDSWMIGDSESDIAAGRAAGCKTALITEKEEAFGQDISEKSLSAFVNKILREEK